MIHIYSYFSLVYESCIIVNEKYYLAYKVLVSSSQFLSDIDTCSDMSAQWLLNKKRNGII